MFISWCKVGGSPFEEQVGRVKQLACIGRGLHMGLGIRSYTPGEWFTHVMLMINVSIISFESGAQLVRIALCML